MLRLQGPARRCPGRSRPGSGTTGAPARLPTAGTRSYAASGQTARISQAVSPCSVAPGAAATSATPAAAMARRAAAIGQRIRAEDGIAAAVAAAESIVRQGRRVPRSCHPATGPHEGRQTV